MGLEGPVSLPASCSLSVNDTAAWSAIYVELVLTKNFERERKWEFVRLFREDKTQREKLIRSEADILFFELLNRKFAYLHNSL